MTFTHGNSYNAINLFYNGGWALKKDDVPAFWQFENLALTGLNNYSLTDNGISITLGSNQPVKLCQDFKAFGAPLDFRVPAQGGIYRNLASGYETTHGRTIPAHTTISIAFDVHREIGDVRFKIFYNDGAADHFSNAQRVSLKTNTRLVFHLFMEFKPDIIGIEVQSDKTATVVIDRVMMAVGQYSDLPYTGDPFCQVFPDNIIIMTLGNVCPPGFEELGEGDLTAPADWEKHEPGVRARKGNYPRSGTELAGSPVHTVTNPQMQNGVADFLEYEGFEGKLFTEHSNVDPGTTLKVFTVTQGNPPVDDYEPHTHTVSEGGSRPASLGLMFCKRL